MRAVGTVTILVGLLLVGVGLVWWNGPLIVVGAVGLFVGSFVRGGRDDGGTTAAVALILCCGAGVSPAGPPLTDSGAGKPLAGADHSPKFFALDSEGPIAAAEQWRVFLETVPEADRPFLFAQWWGAMADEYRRFVTLYRVKLQTVNSLAPLAHSLPVPGTRDRLWFYDVRLCGQTAAARSVVARRDKVFREPFIPHATAEGIRRLQLVRGDVKTFHCESIVPGPWFLRHLEQVDGFSTLYYDLLYAVERFGPEVFKTGVGSAVPAPGGAAVPPPEPVKPGRPWPGGVFPDDGKYYAPGSFNVGMTHEEAERYAADLSAWKKLKAQVAAAPAKVPLPPGQVLLEGKLLKDFPADLRDFQGRWGDAAVRDFLAKVGVKVNNGEIVAGITDDPRRGSIVSYHNRLLEMGGNPFNNGGVNASTKDFFASTGKKNLANFPREAVYGDFEEDGGEHLFTMPNGFQAALVTGAAKDGRKRVDSADGRLVRSSMDPHHGIVFTQYSCFLCHAPSDGVISPGNRRLGGAIDAGRGPLVKNDPISAAVIAQFATDYEWKFQVWRAPYARLVRTMTATKADPRGWDGARLAKETADFIGWYDHPLRLAQASAEFGLPKLGVMLLCLLEGSIDAQNLFLDEGVPRAVWDEDLMPRLGLIHAGLRETDPLSPEGLMYRAFLPDLERQAGEKLKGEKK